MLFRVSRKWTPRLVALIVLGVVCFFCLGPFLRITSSISQNMMYQIDPSAARAMRYGNMHLNASRIAQYDMSRAEYFFTQAALRDPETPFVFHQLARVAFLKSDFPLALDRIDLQIERTGEDSPSAHYVRGLILGYMGKYDEAAESYEVFLKHHPDNWAAITDYAWVLLKAERFQEAADVTERGLTVFPDKAWLLNANAIALYEIGDVAGAYEKAKRAVVAADTVTEREWLTAYPGNDPRIAPQGIATLRKSARDNMHTIEMALASSTVQ